MRAFAGGLRGLRPGVACVCLGAVLAVAARGASPEEETAALEKSLRKPSLGSLLWSVDATLRTGGGYHDNPRLSALNPAGSGFVSGGGELVALRLPVDGHEASVFVSVERRGYLARGFDPETVVAADLRYTRLWGAGWSLGGSFEYLFLHQVFDASELEGVPAVVLAQGHQMTLRPVVARDIGPSWRIEAEIEASRQWLEAPLDGYSDLGPRLGGIWKLGRGQSLGVSYRFRDRFFESRHPRDDAGQELPELLTYSQHEIEVAWRMSWGADQRWRLVLRPGWVRNLDDGNGFYDYDRGQWVSTLRYIRPRWEARLDGRARAYFYPVQTNGQADGAARRRTDLSLTVRGDWKPRHGVRIFAQYEMENSDENTVASDYRANVVSTGVEFEM